MAFSNFEFCAEAFNAITAINSKFEIAEKSNKKSNSEISSNKEEIAIDPIIEQNSVFDCVTINVDFTKNIQFPIIEFKSN